MFALLKSLFTLLLLVAVQPLFAQCDQQRITVALLLPLDDPDYPFVESFMNGILAGNLADLESPCYQVEWVGYPTTQEELFIQQWYRMQENPPDLLVGPLLPQNQQQLFELDLSHFPAETEWLYPGDTARLTVPAEVELASFSLGHNALIRTVLEYVWDQGQHDLALLLQDDELGRSIAERVTADWEGRGGAVVAVSHYPQRFSGLNRALRQLLRDSNETFDLLLAALDGQRLQMIRPLMDYHNREEPVYLLTPPVGEGELQNDMRELYFPLSPELLSRGQRVFDVDDFLLQQEFLGEDMMVMLRSGQWKQLKKSGSYSGKAGRYRVEQGALLRDLCIAVTADKGFESVHCPEQDWSQEMVAQ